METELYHGDCIDVMGALSGPFNMILADLPYGTTQSPWDIVIPFESLWNQYRRLIEPKGAIVLFGAQPFTSMLVMSNLEWFKYCWVWEKNLKTDNLNARKKPMVGHEDIAVFTSALGGTYNPQRRARTTEVKAGNKFNSKTRVYGKQRDDYIDRQSDWIMPDTVLRFKCVHNSAGKLHPNQKPVELLQYLVRTYTNEGETVLDNTMGSGSTGVACVREKRVFVGIEINQDYFDVAQERIKAAQREMIQGAFAF